MFDPTSSNGTSSANSTATARALEKSCPVASAESKLREARLAELREQYKSGNYKVDAAEVSLAIVGQHRKMLAP